MYMYIQEVKITKGVEIHVFMDKWLLIVWMFFANSVEPVNAGLVDCSCLNSTHW